MAESFLFGFRVKGIILVNQLSSPPSQNHLKEVIGDPCQQGPKGKCNGP
ncbi:MAG: hypothetical protein ACP6IY_22235 [Promethearchaeia archaeon]